MLQVNKAPPLESDDPEGLTPSHLIKTFSSFKLILKRQFRVFLVLMACTTALGLLYLLITPPSFTASGMMVIDSHRLQLLQQKPDLGTNAIDPGTVQTEVEVLLSRTISLAVIRELRLTEDPEFAGGNGGLLGFVLKLVPGLGGSGGIASGAQLTDRALAAFESRRTVARVPPAYVIEIGFRSLDPVKSARIANAIADAYVTEQLDAKYQATRRASAWLEERNKELRKQASVADRAVVDFKRANNIVTFEGAGDTVRLMNDQQLSELNSQLILARAAKAEAKARFDRMQDVMKQDVPDASVADVLKSEIIIRLRNQYLDYAARERVWAERYGANHLATVNLRTQMLELRRNINDEMKKIAESYKSDYEIALARERSLENSLATEVTESQITHNAQVQLRDLESNAKSYRTISDSFLQRYMESVQQQSFPITEARLISAAIPPTHKSQPKGLVVLGISTLGGLMLCVAFACYRELSDRVFRTKAQIEESLGANCITTLPSLKSTNPVSSPVTAEDAAPVAERTLVHKHDLMNYVSDSPFTEFTEGLRSLKLVMDLNGVLKSNRVIGLTSTLPSEGKSTIASNFAHLLAQAGRRVILIDCDLRKPSLSQKFASDAAVGLIQVIAGKINLADAVWTEPSSGLTFLPAPAASASKLLHTDEILGSNAMKNLIDRLCETFDHVIVDLSPLLPVIDARATSNFIDSYVYVVEWGQTNRDVVERLLAETPEIHDRLLGVILNKADMRKMARYEGNASSYNYRNYYGRYGYGE
ncbi:MAG: polysaccharide biosynthesis tyrosine autokinase [Methylocella sp.]|nr:MAG: exopolysaccharide biosynthesis protein [Hyphomicrobiales bacterium]